MIPVNTQKCCYMIFSPKGWRHHPLVRNEKFISTTLRLLAVGEYKTQYKRRTARRILIFYTHSHIHRPSGKYKTRYKSCWAWYFYTRSDSEYMIYSGIKASIKHKPHVGVGLLTLLLKNLSCCSFHDNDDQSSTRMNWRNRTQCQSSFYKLQIWLADVWQILFI